MAAYFCLLLKKLKADIDYFIILDDAYHIKIDSSGEEFIKEVVSLLSRNIHLVFSLRSSDATRFGIDRTPRILLDVEDLRFSRAETLNFLDSRTALSVPDAEYLYQRTEGWPLAVDLAAGLAQSGALGTVRDFFGGRSGPGIADHLFSVSLDNLDRNSREFLFLAAICPRFRPEMVKEVLNLVDSEAKMATVLKMYSSVIFSLGQGWYRLHDLFREFLVNSKLSVETDRLESLQVRAGQYFAQSGEYFAAFDLFSTAHDHEKSIAIFEQLAEGMRNRSWILSNYRWVESLPETTLKGSPWLCLCRSRVLEYQGRYQQSNELVTKALESFRHSEDKYGQMIALYQIGKHFHQHKKGIAAKTYLEESLTLARELKNSTMTSIVKAKLASLGRVLGRTDREHSIRTLKQMIADSPGERGLGISAIASHMLGNCLRDVGSYKEALTQYEKSIELKRELGDRYGIAKSLRNEGIAFQHLGHLVQAESCLRQALNIQLNEIGDMPGAVRTLDSLGSCLIAAGHIDDSIVELKRG